MATCVFDYRNMPEGWLDRPSICARPSLAATDPHRIAFHLRPRTRDIRAQRIRETQIFGKTGVKTSGLPRPTTHGRHR